MLIKSDIELKISLSENDCFIVADKNQIEQVLINLATNARDAMPNGEFNDKNRRGGIG